MNRGLSRLYLAVTFSGLLSLGFYGVSNALAFFKSGADPKSMLLIDTHSVNDYYRPAIEWQQPFRHKGRAMEATTLEKVSRDYLASYFHHFQTLRSGNTKGLHDYFTETCRHYLEDLVDWHYENKQFLDGTTISHIANLDFYSADGTILALSDNVVSYEQITRQGRDTLRVYDSSEYRVMMLLEDNFWRIRHRVRMDVPEITRPAPDRSLLPVVHVRGQQLYRGDSLFTIKGMNYYPQDKPWTQMWEHFDADTLASDFEMIRYLGFNTLRVFVPYDLFGAAELKGQHMKNLETLLNLAHQADLMVIVTLFDFFIDYTIDKWTLADRHLEGLISRFVSHPSLLAWDIKNEPDLDFEGHSKVRVTEWLKFIIKRIRTYAPNTLLTIGWSQPEYMDLLAEELDFLSFHFYREPKELSEYLDEHSYEKPLFLGETGCHSFNKWWYPYKRDETFQKAYYHMIFEQIESYGLHYSFWTLYDFEKVPSNVAGRWPWKKGPQKAYGIIDRSGYFKAIFSHLQDFNRRYHHEQYEIEP